MASQITTLHPKISRHFSLEELSALCFKLEIDFEELAGQTKQKKVQSLLEYIGRRGDDMGESFLKLPGVQSLLAR